MTHHDNLFALCLIVAIVGVNECGPVYAQSPDVGLMLAKVMVNEAHFDAVDDHLAIANYTRRVARDRNMPMGVFIANRYRRALAPASERRGRPWIAGLDRTGAMPAGWPQDVVPWDVARPRWLATLDRADAFLRGEIDAPAGCAPHGWGSPVYDREELDRIYAAGGRRIMCGSSRNEFFRFAGQ